MSAMLTLTSGGDYSSCDQGHTRVCANGTPLHSVCIDTEPNTVAKGQESCDLLSRRSPRNGLRGGLRPTVYQVTRVVHAPQYRWVLF
jgi:hypothetical protein